MAHGYIAQRITPRALCCVAKDRLVEILSPPPDTTKLHWIQQDSDRLPKLKLGPFCWIHLQNLRSSALPFKDVGLQIDERLSQLVKQQPNFVTVARGFEIIKGEHEIPLKNA